MVPVKRTGSCGTTPMMLRQEEELNSLISGCESMIVEVRMKEIDSTNLGRRM